MERAYLMEYMSEMFNCMTTKENDVSLSNDKLNSHYIYNGEIEYLLYGNESTIVNKTEATAVLYSLRLAINIRVAGSNIPIKIMITPAGNIFGDSRHNSRIVSANRIRTSSRKTA